jgi:hypothetical protein
MDIKATSDGGAIVCGSTGSFGPGGGDVYVVRVSESGSLLWSTVIGSSQVEVGSAVLILESGFLIVGSSFDPIGAYEGYLAKLDAEGGLVWERRYGTTGWDFLHAAGEADGAYYLAGQSFGGDDSNGDAWVLKVDEFGTLIWEAFTDLEFEDEARSVVNLPDGGCAISGTMRKGRPDQTALVSRFSADGGFMWSTSVGIGSGSTDSGQGIIASVANDLVVCGSSVSVTGTSRMFVGRVSLDGIVDLARTVTSEGDDWGAHDLLEVGQDSIVVVGYTKEYGAGEQDVSMLFLNQGGDFISGPTYGGPGYDVAKAIDRATDGAYYIAGTTRSYGPGPEAMLVIRSDGDTLNGTVQQGFDPVAVEEVAHHHDQAAFYPNPVKAGEFLSHNMGAVSYAALYSIDGRLVAPLISIDRNITIPAIASGPYVVHIEELNGIIQRSLVKVEQ